MIAAERNREVRSVLAATFFCKFGIRTGMDAALRTWSWPVLAVTCLANASAVWADANPSVAQPAAIVSSRAREPHGIYAVIAVDEHGPLDPAELNEVVSNQAITGGLDIRIAWKTVEPAKDKYDFSQLDRYFAAAEANHKSVILGIMPGFWTPDWLMNELASCDPYLKPGANLPAPHAVPRCGKATFYYSESTLTGNMPLPLPWNADYNSRWHKLLGEVAKRYGAREALVSVVVAGPTAASPETLLPPQLARWTRLLEIFYPRDPSYHKSNKAIIEAWKDAIDSHAKVFQGVTMVIALGDGLLKFTPTSSMDAVNAITSYFIGHDLGTNAKALEDDGLRVCHAKRAPILIVKQRAADTSHSPRVLGGLEFGTSFSKGANAMGCSTCTPGACQNILPLQALSDVVAAFFADQGEHLEYLKVYAADILFAKTHPLVQAMLEETSRRLPKH